MAARALLIAFAFAVSSCANRPSDDWDALPPAQSYALGRFELLIHHVRRGDGLELDWQDQMAAEYRKAFASADPFLQTLHRRFADGQSYRAALFNPQSRAYVEEGLSPEDKTAVRRLATERVAEVDRENTDWLEEQVAARGGWFRVSEIGKDYARMAFMLVQHADRTPDVQQKMLALMTPLLGEDEVDRSSYALLWDRVAVNRGQPQRYGSQGGCDGGEWKPRLIEAPDQLDQRRAEMGLPPSAEYTAMMSASCRQG